MFVISQSQTYKWPVKIEVPADGGKFATHTFDAVFKRLSQTRIDEIRKSADLNMQDSDLAREILVGWSGITEESGEEVPFSDSTRDRLLDVPGIASAIVYAFISSLQGAKRKN